MIEKAPVPVPDRLHLIDQVYSQTRLFGSLRNG